MILVIDNYDSFTYNLVQYLGELGAHVQVVRNDGIAPGDIDGLDPEAILLSPGPGNPDEAGITLAVVDRFAGRVPLLGVCLGHQSIAQAFGASVVQADRLMHGRTSQIEHNNAGVFEGVSNPFVATRYHSLVVDPGTLGADLELTAWTAEGEVMGLRHRSHPVQGVQFHPESFLTEHGHHILDNFVRQLPARGTQKRGGL